MNTYMSTKLRAIHSNMQTAQSSPSLVGCVPTVHYTACYCVSTLTHFYIYAYDMYGYKYLDILFSLGLYIWYTLTLKSTTSPPPSPNNKTRTPLKVLGRAPYGRLLWVVHLSWICWSKSVKTYLKYFWMDFFS